MSTVTLQDLCVKVIASNFKWYCEVYCSTEDSCLKLKFELLKKKFSFLVLQKLNDARDYNIEPEYLDILINKYLKVLDVEWLKQWPWETICHRLAEIGTHLEEVTFTLYDRQMEKLLCNLANPKSDSYFQHLQEDEDMEEDEDTFTQIFNRPWEEVLCYLPNLKSVFFCVRCTDEFLLSLSKFCKSVETLDITNSENVSYNGLMHLCCKDDDTNVHSLHIKELIVNFIPVGDESVANALKNMPFLEKIDHHKLPEILYLMHKSDINAFEKVKTYNITHLNLHFIDRSIPEFTNIFKVCASVCPHLKSLLCPIYEKHHLDLCSQLHELEELQLHCCPEDPLELNELLTLNGKKLTSLKVDSCCMSLSILAQNCPKLISLELSRVNLQHNCNDYVPVFHNLEKFMAKFDITKAVSCLLISAPNLKQLCFYRCDLRSSDVKIHILKCCEQCKLDVIDFSSSDVELELVRDVLLTCSTLRILKLNKCDKILNDDDAMHELQTLSTSMPNKPKILKFTFY